MGARGKQSLAKPDLQKAWGKYLPFPPVLHKMRIRGCFDFGVIDQPHEVDLEVPTCLVLVQGGVFRVGALVVDGANWSGLLPLELKR